jgi:GDPmannose 4,6-dehydratase
LLLGNLDAKRDWGHAKEYVEAMWLMLQQDEPDDYVIATGETYSVRDFLDVAFEHLGLNWRDFVDIDAKYYRPAEVDLLVGDSSKAKKKLGWEPKIKFQDLVREMVDHEVNAISRS